MNATADHKLPFGNLPRLILAWLSTEVVRTQSRELVLGKSLSEFMRTLGVYSSAGGGLLTICQGQKSYKKGQLLPVSGPGET